MMMTMGQLEKTYQANVQCDKKTIKEHAEFDKSAKNGNEPSINDCLYAGPCLLRQLYGILVRFCLHNIIFISDIKQASFKCSYS